MFDNVVTNKGNGYHNTYDTFIAPVSGLHVFYSSLLDFSSICHAQLVKNGQVLAMFDNQGRYNQAGQLAIVQLNAGDDVAVQSADYADCVFTAIIIRLFLDFCFMIILCTNCEYFLYGNIYEIDNKLSVL